MEAPSLNHCAAREIQDLWEKKKKIYIYIYIKSIEILSIEILTFLFEAGQILQYLKPLYNENKKYRRFIFVFVLQLFLDCVASC